MKQLLALTAVGCLGLCWSAAASGSVVHASSQATTFEHRLVQVERAVRGLPCVLAPATRKGCPRSAP